MIQTKRILQSGVSLLRPLRHSVRSIRAFSVGEGGEGEGGSVSNPNLPTFADVREASRVLEGVALETPILTSRTLNQRLGHDIEVYIKCESFQRTGAFKFRGAYNALWHLTNQQRKNGVVTFSSGNHAQAMALSARLLGCEATIVMPDDAPKIKVAATRDYGANIIFYNRYKENRELIAKELQDTKGCTLVPPFDDKYVIAGQGTSGLELLQTLKEKHGVHQLDYLVVPVSGGGLMSGCALAAQALVPQCRVIGVEPALGNDAQQSLQRGEIVHIDTPQTIADGAQAQHIGQLTFGIMKDTVDRILTVTDLELIETMRFFGERMKIVVEPTGCLALAGLERMARNGEISPGSKCGVLISGGNVDLARYCKLLNQ